MYLKHLVWPFNLSVFYNTPYVNTPGLTNFLLPLVLISLVAALLLWWARRARAVAVAAAWLVLPILPALKISAYEAGDIFHDRYLYLPSIGFAILVAVGLRQIGSAIAKDYSYAPAVVAFMLACLYGYGALRESRPWAADLRLYSHALEVSPNHFGAVSNLGAELADQRRYDEAIPYLKKALEQRPDAWKLYHALSYCYYQYGRYGEALVYIRRAIQLSPDNPVLHLRLGITLIATDRLAEAEDAVRKALALQTGGKGINVRFQGAETGGEFIYHFTLGDILKSRGDLRGALAEFNAGLADQPDEGNAQKAQQTVRWLEAELSKAEDKR
jgi:tetratricopeptide (TPR) repeat protein